MQGAEQRLSGDDVDVDPCGLVVPVLVLEGTLGAGLHAGLAGAFTPYLLASVEIGYVDLDLIDDDDRLHPGRGIQATVRGEVPLSRQVQLFSELRYQQPRDSSDSRNLRHEIGEGRLGVRLNF